MNESFESENDRLQAVLRESRPNPGLPPRFRESVWTRIEQMESARIQKRPAFLGVEWLAERFLVPRFALASLILVLVAGALTGLLTSENAARQQAQERYLAAVAPNPVR